VFRGGEGFRETRVFRSVTPDGEKTRRRRLRSELGEGETKEEEEKGRKKRAHHPAQTA